MNKSSDIISKMKNHLINGIRYSPVWTDVIRRLLIIITNLYRGVELIEQSRNEYNQKGNIIHGCCFGMSIWFIVQYLHLEGPSFISKLKYIGKQFINGSDRISYELQINQCDKDFIIYQPIRNHKKETTGKVINL